MSTSTTLFEARFSDGRRMGEKVDVYRRLIPGLPTSEIFKRCKPGAESTIFCGVSEVYGWQLIEKLQLQTIGRLQPMRLHSGGLCDGFPVGLFSVFDNVDYASAKYRAGMARRLYPECIFVSECTSSPEIRVWFETGTLEGGVIFTQEHSTFRTRVRRGVLAGSKQFEQYVWTNNEVSFASVSAALIGEWRPTVSGLFAGGICERFICVEYVQNHGFYMGVRGWDTELLLAKLSSVIPVGLGGRPLEFCVESRFRK